MALTPEQIAQMDKISGISNDKFKEMDALINGDQPKQKKGVGTPYDWANNFNFAKEAALMAPINAIKDKKTLKEKNSINGQNCCP